MHKFIMLGATWLCLISQAFAQSSTVSTMLDKLHSAPKPTVQADLNTLQLASAQRERADSYEDRTNGLWQSWAVAICQGCGVRERLYSKMDATAMVGRAEAQMKLTLKQHPDTDMVSIAPRRVRPLETLEKK